MKKLKVYYLKNINYTRCTKFQLALRENLIKTNNKCFLIIATHNDVITFGKNKTPNDILVSKEYLKKQNISLIETCRGGKATCHGNGQLVFYPIVNLKNLNLKIIDYVNLLEDAVINTLKYVNINAIKINDMQGVFVNNNNIIKKIAFIGIHVKRYHTMHGISVNITSDILHLFKLINPCGFKDLQVTSIESLINKKISYDEFIKYFIIEFAKAFNFKKEDIICKL